MARLAFPPFLRVFKDNGDVCTDATATWYDAGTTTPVDSYPTAADADASTNPNTNPVTANALGIFPQMWLADAEEYKVVIAGTGITTQTIDEVYATASLDQLSGDRRYLGLAGGAAYTTTGSSNAYVVSTGLSTSSLSTYETLLIKPNFTNSGAATLNVDSIGAKNIFSGGVALSGGELVSGRIYQVSYDGTQFQIVNSNGRPHFRANKNGTNQTGIADITNTKVTFTTEAVDNGGYYDAANSRWTPPAGPVQIEANVTITGTFVSGLECRAFIYKNGADFMRSAPSHTAGTGGGTVSVSIMDVANGTDYYEIYVYGDVSSGTITVAGSLILSSFTGICL